MILYHGSNIEINEPRLLNRQRKLDFGPGFYTTSDLDQAFKWSKRTVSRSGSGEPVVSVYELDEVQFKTMQVKVFDKADSEWLAFVTENRIHSYVPSSWDVIVGPVADDQTVQTLFLYFDGFLNEEETLKRLLTHKFVDQYTFKTEKAISLLKCKEYIRA